MAGLAVNGWTWLEWLELAGKLPEMAGKCLKLLEMGGVVGYG